MKTLLFLLLIPFALFADYYPSNGNFLDSNGDRRGTSSCDGWLCQSAKYHCEAGGYPSFYDLGSYYYVTRDVDEASCKCQYQYCYYALPDDSTPDCPVGSSLNPDHSATCVKDEGNPCNYGYAPATDTRTEKTACVNPSDPTDYYDPDDPCPDHPDVGVVSDEYGDTMCTDGNVVVAPQPPNDCDVSTQIQSDNGTCYTCPSGTRPIYGPNSRCDPVLDCEGQGGTISNDGLLCTFPATVDPNSVCPAGYTASCSGSVVIDDKVKTSCSCVISTDQPEAVTDSADIDQVVPISEYCTNNPDSELCQSASSVSSTESSVSNSSTSSTISSEASSTASSTASTTSSYGGGGETSSAESSTASSVESSTASSIASSISSSVVSSVASSVESSIASSSAVSTASSVSSTPSCDYLQCTETSIPYWREDMQSCVCQFIEDIPDYSSSSTQTSSTPTCETLTCTQNTTATWREDMQSCICQPNEDFMSSASSTSGAATSTEITNNSSTASSVSSATDTNTTSPDDSNTTSDDTSSGFDLSSSGDTGDTVDDGNTTTVTSSSAGFDLTSPDLSDVEAKLDLIEKNTDRTGDILNEIKQDLEGSVSDADIQAQGINLDIFGQVTNFVGNAENSFNTVQQSFDQTQSILTNWQEGGTFGTYNIQSYENSSCFSGDAFGSNLVLSICPNVSPLSPIITLIVTGFLIFIAIKIFLLGFAI